jgi:glycolate oxidase
MDLLTGPNLKEPYWKLRYKGSVRDIFFLCPPSRASYFVGMLKSLAQIYDYPYKDLGGYIQPLVQGRGCYCEFNVLCDESNQGERDRVERFFIEASTALMREGAFFSRPYGLWADMVYKDDAGEVAALKKLKGIFDLYNILNPGKLCF